MHPYPASLHGEVFELEISVDSPLPLSTTEGTKSNKSIDPSFYRPVSFFVPHSVSSMKDVPLLIAFHGSTETGTIFRSRTTAYAYDELACTEGFVVAYPTGYKGNWNEYVFLSWTAFVDIFLLYFGSTLKYPWSGYYHFSVCPALAARLAIRLRLRT